MRRALVGTATRWALVAVGALTALALLGAGPGELAVAGFFGLLAAPGAVLDAARAGRPPSRFAARAALAATLTLAPVVVVQAAYVAGLVAGGIDAGYGAVQEVLTDPLALVGQAAALGLGWAVALVYRLREPELLGQLGRLIAEALFVAALLAAVVGVSSWGGWRPVQGCALLCLGLAGCSAALGAALLCVVRLAGELERRLGA